MEIYGWSMAQTFSKEEWRYVSIMPGAPSALVLSVKMTLKLYADKFINFHLVCHLRLLQLVCMTQPKMIFLLILSCMTFNG